jgi:hypothetical protein
VRVVVDGQPLRRARRKVRVRLGRMAELGFEDTTELGERRPAVMQALEHERGSGGPLGHHLADLGGAAER